MSDDGSLERLGAYRADGHVKKSRVYQSHLDMYDIF